MHHDLVHEELTWTYNLLRYTERPHTLKNVTSAEWAVLYDVCQKPNKICNYDTDNLIQENLIDDNSDDEFDFDNHMANIKKQYSNYSIQETIKSKDYQKCLV